MGYTRICVEGWRDSTGQYFMEHIAYAAGPCTNVRNSEQRALQCRWRAATVGLLKLGENSNEDGEGCSNNRHGLSARGLRTGPVAATSRHAPAAAGHDCQAGEQNDCGPGRVC